MAVFYIIMIIIGLTVQNVAKKAYNLKVGGSSAFTFAFGSVVCALIFFIISSGFKLDFRLEVIPYSIGFALSYGAAVVCSFYAIRFGSLSLSSLISNYSLTIPTFYGIFFLDEQTSPLLYLGLCALMISLFLVNFKPKSKSGDMAEKKTRTDPRWFLFVALSFLGNGICSTVQTVQQKTFDGQYKSEMMIMALLIVILILLVMALLTERKNIGSSFRRGGILMAVNGGFNAVVNLFVMLCAVIMNASVMFPIMSAGGIIGTALVSVLLYKEKLTKMQYVGFALGILAIVLLNI